MVNINKIARQLLAMQFNYYNEDSIVILSNNQNGHIQYFVQISENNYHVLKIKKLSQIQKVFNDYSIDQLNQFLFGSSCQDLLNYKQHFVECEYNFDEKQLQNYFVVNDKIRMSPLHFYKIFKIKSSNYYSFQTNGFTVFVENNYNKTIVDNCMKIFNVLKCKRIFYNCCFVFTNKIVERDGHDIGGDYIGNTEQFEAQFTIGNKEPLFDFFHQIAHYISQKLFSKTQLKEIFDCVKNNKQKFNFKDDYYLTNQNECFSQLFAHYYSNKFNKQSLLFVQNKILNKF